MNPGTQEVIGRATLGVVQRFRWFRFQGRRYRYHSASYNSTWSNERTVELPIALHHLVRKAGGRTLEVGNVLHHYVKERHDVADKYEQADGVQNIDILDFSAEQPYDLIVSISTLEHVGPDEDVKDPGKPRRAVEHLTSMLAPAARCSSRSRSATTPASTRRSPPERCGSTRWATSNA